MAQGSRLYGSLVIKGKADTDHPLREHCDFYESSTREPSAAAWKDARDSSFLDLTTACAPHDDCVRSEDREHGQTLPCRCTRALCALLSLERPTAKTNLCYYGRTITTKRQKPWHRPLFLQGAASLRGQVSAERERK
jgi:hypothetical protein